MSGVVMVLLLVGARLALGKNCEIVDQCACQFDDGSGKVDLTSLGNKDSTPRFHNVQSVVNQKYYSYNPCGAFEEGECTNAAVCELTTDKSRQVTIGEANRTTFSYDEDTGKVTAAYTAGSGVFQKTEVFLTCDPKACDPVFQPIDKEPLGFYEMHLTTVCACPNKCTAAGPTYCHRPLGAGSVILIIFFSALVLYFITGVIFMKFVKRAEGKEVIPNVSFWAALPGLIKDGFAFIFGGCKRPKTSYDSI